MDAARAVTETPNHGAGHEDLDRDGFPERHTGREARSHRRRQVRRGGDLRERPRDLQRHAGRTCDERLRGARPRHRHPAAVPRLRGHAGGPARARLRARRTQVRRHAGARHRSPDDLQQRGAGIAGRHRPRGRRSARAGRARRQARPAHRLRGAGLGPAHQRLPRRLGGGAPRRPSRGRPGPRPSTSWRAAPTSAPSAPSRATASSWCSSPTRRSCRWTTCRGAVTSATSRPGRPAGRRFHGGAGRPPTYDGRAVAGNLQRPVPRRLGAQPRGRRPSLAALPARPARPPDRQAAGGRACPAAAVARRGRELHRILRRR